VKCATLPSGVPSRPIIHGLHDSPWKYAKASSPQWMRIECPMGLVAVGIQTGHECSAGDWSYQRKWDLLCNDLNTDGGYKLDYGSSSITPWLRKGAHEPEDARLSCDVQNEVVTAVDFTHAAYHDHAFEESFRLTCTPLLAPGCPAWELETERELKTEQLV